jgi:hypothetical protein
MKYPHPQRGVVAYIQRTALTAPPLFLVGPRCSATRGLQRTLAARAFGGAAAPVARVHGSSACVCQHCAYPALPDGGTPQGEFRMLTAYLLTCTMITIRT